MSLVSLELILRRWVKGFLSKEDVKRGYPRAKSLFTSINSSSVKTVAGRHKFAQCYKQQDLLLIITNTTNDLSGGTEYTDIDDLERP